MQAQLEEGATFLDKAGAVAMNVTGALRNLAPSKGGDGEGLVESVSDHLESAGERVQKVPAANSRKRRERKLHCRISSFMPRHRVVFTIGTRNRT